MHFFSDQNFIDLCAQKENSSSNLEKKDELAMVALAYALLPCSPKLDIKCHASAPKER